MANYIDQEKLVMTISSTASEVARESPYDRVWFSRMAARQAEIINIIYDMPAADVVEVVRCKDCMYCKSGKWGKSCTNEFGIFNKGVFDNDFCAYGKRREKNE